MSSCPSCGSPLSGNGFCAHCNAAAQYSQHVPPPGSPPQQGYGQQGNWQQGYGAPQGYPPPPLGEHSVFRSPVNCILLSIITCGIYYLYWLWVTNKQINNLIGSEHVSSGMLVLGWFCVPVMWYVWYKWDNALQEIAPRYNVRYNANFILWIILTVFVGFGNVIMMFQVQDTLNNIYGR